MQDAVDFSERSECLAYYETSAKDAINIDEVFFTIALAAFQQMKETQKSNQISRPSLVIVERQKSDAGDDFKKLFRSEEKKKGSCC